MIIITIITTIMTTATFRSRASLPLGLVVARIPSTARSDTTRARYRGPDSTPIHPVRPGTVVSSGDRGYGNVVVLDTGTAPRASMLTATAKVKKGDKVGHGDIIATVGSIARQDLLHLEVHRDGKAVDPMAELKRSLRNTNHLVSRMEPK